MQPTDRRTSEMLESEHPLRRLRRTEGLAFAVLGGTSLAIWSFFSLLS